MQKGKLSVHTENILPVIKKWLYSEKEIFVRELVSNAVDAITKLRKVSLSEEIYQQDSMENCVNIRLDREKGVLIIEDDGIGMSAEEIEKYIAQIAFSGAEDFAKRFEESKDKAGIIGNFGLGFYSSFMVATRVEVVSRSYRKDEKSARFISDGGDEYEIGEGDRVDRGTEIRLYLDEEEKEFLEKARISELVRKYCDFLPVPIKVDDSQVNRMEPLWSKAPSSLKREDYVEFYKYLFPYQGDPLFYVHINVDYPFRLQGILYFPRLSHEMDLNNSGVKIYCKQVFVTNEAQEIIPKFLTVLQGVLDMPELPLNVSRSYVQNEPQVKKIANHIIKKVSDRLAEERKLRPEEYAEIWPEIAPFVKYGMMNDDRFYDQAKDALLFEIANVEPKKMVTIEEYKAENQEKAGDKIYYVSDLKSQNAPLSLLKSQGIQALRMDTLIDSHFIQFLEYKGGETGKFTRVDAELAEDLVDKNGEIVGADDRKESDRIMELFKGALGGDSKVTVRVEKLKSEEIPAMILLPEQARRMSEMSAYMMKQEPGFPADHTLLVNAKNPLVKQLVAGATILAADGSSSGRSAKKEKAACQIYYLARLSQGSLSPTEVETYVQLTQELVGEFLN